MTATKSHQRKSRFPGAFLMLFVLTASAFAQWPMPPARSPQRTARVQYISGEVSVASSETSQWTAARLYQTLTPAEYIWTGKNSRTEISVGDGFLRMNSEASVTLLAVNGSTVQIGVNQGEVSLTVAHLSPGEIYEIDTPNATLTVTKAGTYRVEVHPDQDKTLVTARRGSIVATGGSSAVTIKEGERVLFTSGNSLQHTAEKAPSRDGFEEWASVRDQRLGVGRHPFGVGFGYGPGPYGPPPPPPLWVR